jgi:hypothetical protein
VSSPSQAACRRPAGGRASPRRIAELPDTFPRTKRYAAELTSGAGRDRFDFTISLIIDGLVHRH